jgi:hypothetical protein
MQNKNEYTNVDLQEKPRSSKSAPEQYRITQIDGTEPPSPLAKSSTAHCVLRFLVDAKADCKHQSHDFTPQNAGLFRSLLHYPVSRSRV